MIRIEDLSVAFGGTEVVKHVNLELQDGEILGIVGESGSGKSVTALTLMGLVAETARVTTGRILFDNVALREAGVPFDSALYRKYRGAEMSMVFQEPQTSLNPTQKAGRQVEEVLRLHTKLTKEEIRTKVLEAFRAVGLQEAERVYDSYPHQLSGGMRQRVMIAMALACRPKLLIADEPTTALDVTIQAQVLDLMRELRKEFDTAILFITHDLGVVAEICSRVAVMYAGYIVEEAEVTELFYHPAHPYTQGLLASIPRIDEDKEELYTIKGAVPHPSEVPDGCYFHPRCPYATDRCRQENPPLEAIAPGHRVRCWHPGGQDTPNGGSHYG